MNNMEKRKICVITGSRSEYGILTNIMKEIVQSDILELKIIAAGMHNFEKFGKTINEIKKDGFDLNSVVEMGSEKEDSNEEMARSVAQGIKGIADALEKIKPQITLVLGDRIEALSGAIASAYSGIPVAHVHGGDIGGGSIDELARGAITKFSHIHFAATEKSAERIKQMGEAKWRVHIVGAPSIDAIHKMKLPEKNELFERYGFDTEQPLILVVQHPVTTESDLAVMQIKETLEAIKEISIQTLLVYPNADAGGRRMISVIEEYANELKFIRPFKNLPYSEYLGFMKYASVMAGNSSSGIIEAPTFKLPVVNIGIREKGRERAINVIDTTHNRKEIINAIEKARGKEFREKLKSCKSPYGDGHASKRIVEVLEKIEIGKRLIQKQLIEE